VKLLREHITFKILTLVLIASLFVPSVAKFAHVFSHHEHEVCKNNQTTHIHKIDFDCDFHKFNLNNTFTFTAFNIEFFIAKKESREIISQYNFLSKFQRLQTSLRGPPSLI